MAGYYAIRDGELARAEQVTGGYDTELAEYWAVNPRTTFRQYLIHRRQEQMA